MVDTGFTGFLTLPSVLIAALGLAWKSRGLATLADGSRTFYDMHEGTVIWDGRPVTIAIDSADTTPLVGMLLLDGFKLTIEGSIGGIVTIEAVP